MTILHTGLCGIPVTVSGRVVPPMRATVHAPADPGWVEDLRVAYDGCDVTQHLTDDQWERHALELMDHAAKDGAK